MRHDPEVMNVLAAGVAGAVRPAFHLGSKTCGHDENLHRRASGRLMPGHLSSPALGGRRLEGKAVVQLELERPHDLGFRQFVIQASAEATDCRTAAIQKGLFAVEGVRAF
jgi:hypothetical protein